MFCKSMKKKSEALPPAEFFAQVRILERVEIKATQQVVYLICCPACKSAHSIEYAPGQEPLIVSGDHKLAA